MAAEPTAISVEEMETAFSVGVQDLGEPFFDLLMEQGLTSDDPAFIESHAEAMPGYERDLAQAVESVRLCAALKDARGEDLLAALLAQ